MSENHQFVENPLHLTDIFSGGVYYFKEEMVAESESLVVGESVVVNPNLEEGMIQLSIINLFFDQRDEQFSSEINLAYTKLMSAVKINQDPVIPEDIEKVYAIGKKEYTPSLLGDFLAPVIFVWSDHEIEGIPATYAAKPTEKGMMLR
ncbi:MAG: hypothetical protein NTZ00_07395, partial [Bacteroidetes bacterium]|nr:hypothetical protein [Bacteroidota bacterium]